MEKTNSNNLTEILSKVNARDIVLNIRKKGSIYIADTLHYETIRIFNPDLYVKLTKNPLRIGNVYLRSRTRFNKPSKI